MIGSRFNSELSGLHVFESSPTIIITAAAMKRFSNLLSKDDFSHTNHNFEMVR